MGQPIAPPRTYTEQDRRDLQQIKDAVSGRLRQQHAVSELIWDAGHGMYEADARGLWPADLADSAGAGDATPRRRGSGRPTREQWASQVFQLSDRQARKYFRVGERLTRDEVAGTGLCLDRMEQLALAPAALRDVLRALGREGVSARALSSGRRAALAWLEADDVAGARAAAERAARLDDRAAERREGRPGPRARPGSAEAVADEPDAELACVVASEVLEEVERLGALPAEALDPDALGRLVSIAERLVQSARQAQLRAQDRPALSTGEDRKEASGPTAAAPPAPARTYARPTPGTPISFLPLLDAPRGLGGGARDMLVTGLARVIGGRSVAAVEEMLHPAYEGLCRGAPAALAGAWMSLLTEGDWEPRGRFALWFARKLGALPASFYVNLWGLRAQELPPGLRAEVDALIGEAAFVLRGMEAGDKTRHHGQADPRAIPEA